MPTTKSVMPQHLLIAALLANPMLKHDDIAKSTGVCKSVVDKVSQQLKAAVSRSDVALEAYKMLAREQVPVTSRVAALKTIVEKADSNPFAALKGIEYVDNLEGFNPKQQETQQLAESRPMFMLPAGTKIAINLTTPDDTVDITPSDTDTGYKNDL
jgi:hypothetical protein